MTAATAAGIGGEVNTPFTAAPGTRAVRLEGAPGVGGTGHPDVSMLIRAHRIHHPRVSVRAIRRAYRVAERAHRGQMRKSGEPYITHPLAVAMILAELGMDTITLIAALLHDTVEDTHYTLGQLANDFGEDVAHLVDGVTKLDKVYFGGIAEAETTRKMILAAGKDVRVFVIKLADRLHNMRTLGAKSSASRSRIAKVTRDILVPLAGRLGIQLIKRELEDLVLANVDPEAWALIDVEVAKRSDSRRAYVARFSHELASALSADSISAKIVDRPRHYTSIRERMVVRETDDGKAVELHDDPRVVVMVSGDPYECYAALGVVHGQWRPVPGRFKDFIATPKFNLYKSLHTTVIGPERSPVDILIRTEQMHLISETGIAARCRPRRRDGLMPDFMAKRPPEQQELDDWSYEGAELDWLQRLLDWQGEATADRFLESLRFDLADHEMSVFTPDGESLSLPAGATPVDVAYTLGASIGDRCIGARVNAQLAPLSSPLSEGDVVEILTSQYGGPKREWLDFVRSSRAHVQIQQWFTEHEAATAKSRRTGKRAIVEAMVAHERILMYEQPLIAVAGVLGFHDVDALYAAVAEGTLAADDVVSRIITMVDGG